MCKLFVTNFLPCHYCIMCIKTFSYFDKNDYLKLCHGTF
uniref:Uncharacterized protein n=1 Tax=Anguilla anguilla TaxID=7936 RepID=A0A0E9P552_ANGAN